MSYGFHGKVLHVDLNTGENRVECLPERLYRLLLGGKGLGTWLLYREMSAGTSPLSPDNPLILATGPLTGTSAPTSSRCALLTKSPATGFLLDSYCGGFLGQQIKYAGVDAVVIKGKAASPSVLVIDDNRVTTRDGQFLVKLTTADKTKLLREEFGESFSTIVIGPAGERLSPIASIFSEWRCFGRGGAAAVMSSKNLLGIAIRGNHPIPVFEAQEFERAVWVADRFLRMSTAISRLKDRGTANIVELINAAGGLPTRNFRFGQCLGAEKLDGKAWKNSVWRHSRACFNCPIACTKIAVLDSPNSPYFGTEIDGPEYETIFSLGSNCDVWDLEALVYANYLCDLYGVDTISVGVIVSYAMELYENGYIGKDELDGVEAVWGNADALVALVEKICKGEGCGQWLELGVRRLSEERFPHTKNFAMHSKGLELPGYLPNAAMGIGLGYAVSERGGCHLHGATLHELMGGADPLKTEGKAQMFKMNQADVAVIDSAILCYFVKFGFTMKEIFDLVNPCTGLGYKDPAELEKVGERIITLSRLLNIREGLSRADDSLPERCTKEPLEAGPAKGHTVPLKELLDEYYALMGWEHDGKPKPQTVRALELEGILGCTSASD